MKLLTPLQALLWQPWRTLRRRSQIKQATMRAYRQWAQCYPEWVVGLFDEHFVLYHVVPLLQEAGSEQLDNAPVRLVEQWADQFHLAPAQRQLRCHALLPAVIDFLNRFEAALGCQPVNPPNRRSTYFSKRGRLCNCKRPLAPVKPGGVYDSRSDHRTLARNAGVAAHFAHRHASCSHHLGPRPR